MRIVLLIGLIIFSFAASAQEEEKAERIVDAGARMKIGTASIIGGTGVVVVAGGSALLINGVAEDVNPVVPALIAGVGVTAGLAAVTFGTIQIVKASKELSSIDSRHRTSPPVLSISATGTGAKLQLRF